MAIRQLEEPLFRVLKAQQANLSRIKKDLLLPGTDWRGDNIRLWGPTPNVIRLYDTPLRFIEGDALSGWERILTLSPVGDRDRAAIVNRNDRTFTYHINCLVRLTPPEERTDRQQTLTNAVRALNPLAEKAHKLLFDIEHLLYDDENLSDSAESCLVMHSTWRIIWEPNVMYPMNMFIVEVTSDWGGV